MIDVIVLGHDLPCRTDDIVFTGRCCHGITFVHVLLLLLLLLVVVVVVVLCT